MKVTGVKVYLVASGKLHPVLVEVATDSGIAGIGEAAIAYGVGGTAAAGMAKDLGKRMLLSRDPFRIEDLWSEMQVLHDSPEDRISNGYVEIPNAPGLGVVLATERIRPFLWAECT